MKLNILLSSVIILAGSSLVGFHSPQPTSSAQVAKAASTAPLAALNAAYKAAPHATLKVAYKETVDTASKLARRSDVASTYVIDGQHYHVLQSAKGYNKKGVASWYGPGFQNRRTSSDTIYNMYAMTAASPTLPLNTYVKVTDLKNHRSVIVKVNDRGPFAKNRVMDLSYAAAKKLNMVNAGTAYVDIKAINLHTLHNQPSVAT